MLVPSITLEFMINMLDEQGTPLDDPVIGIPDDDGDGAASDTGNSCCFCQQNKTKRHSQASAVTSYANNVQCHASTHMVNKTVLYFIIASHPTG
jgi:hypothetical protein